MNNKKGVSLITVMITLMMLMVMFASFQVSVMSFTTRTTKMSNDTQAYISARSVSSAVVDKLVSETENYILSQSEEIVDNMGGLPDDVYNKGLTSMGFTNDQLTVIGDLQNMNVGDVITFDDITFNNFDNVSDSEKVDIGTISCKLEKEANSFLIESTAKTNTATETVKVRVDYLELQSIINSGSRGEIVADWNGMYTDFGFGVPTDGLINNNNAESKISSGIAQPHIATNGNLFTDADMYAVNQDFKEGSGTLNALGDIYLDNMKHTSPTELISGGTIYVGDNVQINNPGSTMQAQDIVIDGDNSSLHKPIITNDLFINGDSNIINNSATVNADLVEINGDNCTIQGEIIANTVIINGDNIVFNSSGVIKADYIELNGENCTILSVNTNELVINSTKFNFASGNSNNKANKLVISNELSNITTDNWNQYFYTLDGKVTINGVETTPSGGRIQCAYRDVYISELTTPITIMNNDFNPESPQVHTRTKPYQIDLIPEEDKIYVGDGETLKFKNQGIHLYDSNGDLIKSLTPTEFSFWEQTCIILEGNGKLEIDHENWQPKLVYAPAIDIELENEIKTKIQDQIDAIDQSLTAQEIRDKIASITTEVMDSYLDQIAHVVVTSNVRTVCGDFVVPYIKFEGSSLTYEHRAYVLSSDQQAAAGDLDIQTEVLEETVEDFILLTDYKYVS